MIRIDIDNQTFSASVSIGALDVVTLSTRNNGRESYDVCVVGDRKQTVRVDSTVKDRSQLVTNSGSVRDEESEEAISLSIQRVRG